MQIILIGVAILGLLAIAIPNFIRARGTPARNPCINILRQIDGAKQQWAMENHKLTNDVPTWEDIQPYLHMPVSCPQGGTYSLGTVADLPACSIGRHGLSPRE